MTDRRNSVSRSHTFNFSFYGEPTLDELINELKRAADVMGGASRCRIVSQSDQRDGYSMNVKVTGELK